MTTIVVLAKPCVPGRVKTRLHPPLTLDDAARVAAASLDDTLVAVERCGFTRRVLCFDGEAPLAPPRARDTGAWEVRRQAAGGLDERIAAVLDGLAGERVVLVGMDTPQLDVAVLDRLAREPWPADAWFGPADDGGFWLLGLARSRGDVVRGVPMSRDDTGARQRARLLEAGLRVADLEAMRDIDTYEDLAHVAALVPGSATAGVLAGVLARLGSPA